MNTRKVLSLLLIGLVAAMLSSMVGIGGGVVVVPCLVFILGLSQKNAQGTSLAMLMPPIGILSVIIYSKAGYVQWAYAGLMCITFVAGSYIGSIWVKNLNTTTVKKVFAIFMIVVAVKYLFFDKSQGTTSKNQDAGHAQYKGSHILINKYPLRNYYLSGHLGKGAYFQHQLIMSELFDTSHITRSCEIRELL